MEGPELGGRNWGTKQGATAGGVRNWQAEQWGGAGALELGSWAEEGTAEGPELGAGDQNWRQQGVQSWRAVVRPRVDHIRDHCGGHNSVVPVWVSSLPTCFLPGS